MAHKCFISFKTEDLAYKTAIQNMPGIEMVDKSLNEAIDSTNEDYILQKIRVDCLHDSTVTIHLIGNKSAECLGYEEQKFIKRELQASLYSREGGLRNGILGVVLPHASSAVYKGVINCLQCNGTHHHVKIDDETTVKEFSYNYYIPHGKCAHTDDERYCVLVEWYEFISDPNRYIEEAFQKRDHHIANKIKVRP